MSSFNDLDDSGRGARAVAASAQGGAGSANSVSLTPGSGMTMKLVSFIVSAAQVTAVGNGLLTVGGLAAGNLYYEFVETVSAGGLIERTFEPPLPASSVNTAITISLAPIAGGSVTAITATGWQV